MNYIIIGRGRLARHLEHYFEALGLRCAMWHRDIPIDTLRSLVDISAVPILLCIDDDAIEPFLQEHPWMPKNRTIHCSGSRYLEEIPGLHPLCTFADDLYNVEAYESIPFVADRQGIELPGVPNPIFSIEPGDKPLYHALCVLAGNCTTLLWQKLFEKFPDIGLPPESALPYLLQVTENLIDQPKSCLTGPFVRGDQKTIESNLAALGTDAYASVYDAFRRAHERPRVSKPEIAYI